MKIAALILTALLCLTPYITHAEQLNYTDMITAWVQHQYLGQSPSFTVKEVIDLGVETNGFPTGNLAMWVVVHVKDHEDHHIILISAQGVTSSKPFNPNTPPSEEGPSCTPEEHTQHHGKDA